MNKFKIINSFICLNIIKKAKLKTGVYLFGTMGDNNYYLIGISSQGLIVVNKLDYEKYKVIVTETIYKNISIYYSKLILSSNDNDDSFDSMTATIKSYDGEEIKINLNFSKLNNNESRYSAKRSLYGFLAYFDDAEGEVSI